MPTRRTLRAALLGVVVFAALAGAPATAALADDAPDEGITIDVQVLGPSASPSPSGSSAGGGSSSGGGSSTPDTAEVPAAGEPGLGDDAVDLGGVLYVGGLRGSIVPNVGAPGGNAELAITVRNTSTKLADLHLRFWLKNGFGATIGEVSNLEARDLLPDETRTIRATITTVGQWTVYTAHVTVTPPKELDGVKLSAITRDTALFVPPYFLAVTGSLVGLLYVAIRYLLARRFVSIGVPA